MKKKAHYIIVSLQTIALVVSISVIIKLNRRVDFLEQAQMNLAVNEKIEYFDLLGMDNQRISAEHLNRGRTSLIFVFKYPCAACNHNLTLWRRMAKILKKDIDIYGIWLGNEQELFDFVGESNTSFNIYLPLNTNRLKKELKLNLNYARTILYARNRVIRAKMADLEGDDYTQILKTAKQLSKAEGR